MSYIKAIDVLPEELLELIQNYIDGEYIYIPRKECNRRAWGETTESKRKISIRNSEIYNKYKEGISVRVLSEMYYLSPKSIQRIISNMNSEN
ncbi:CD3324 family protein [Clostridium autoethanogenum]|uniref:CD3324 family protein n=1 Tax=Clostridium autoethanogenum DSM 10061 TaxID=1341692 RepID=A0ABN4BKA0_9CLOT|nr:CD3324 family protein [Clostridium autoethanogenum]AGY78176.1 CD3324 family protein [Clostridium autoethanogenum DSM 10061]ALU38309.1 putative transcrptional activator Mor family [Clostridium autoethanogenum DSM 10061]OVY51072.1 Mor transcription activator family protein [Clostridium autoethanogenum]